MDLEPRHTLFDFKDIGVEGVRRWVQESDEWARTVGPLVLWTFGGNSSIEIEVMQIAVALEALGHKVAVRQGRIRSDQGLNFPEYLRLIGETLQCDEKFVIAGSPDNGVPPYTDYKAWSNDFNTIYKQCKHADHPLPDGIRGAIAARSGALLLRMWLAQEFGVDPEIVDQYAGYS